MGDEITNMFPIMEITEQTRNKELFHKLFQIVFEQNAESSLHQGFSGNVCFSYS